MHPLRILFFDVVVITDAYTGPRRLVDGRPLAGTVGRVAPRSGGCRLRVYLEDGRCVVLPRRVLRWWRWNSTEGRSARAARANGTMFHVRNLTTGAYSEWTERATSAEEALLCHRLRHFTRRGDRLQVRRHLPHSRIGCACLSEPLVEVTL